MNASHHNGTPLVTMDDMDELERQQREEFQQFIKEHQNHAGAHTLMFLIVLVMLFLSQVVLVLWRLKSPRTFNLTTLVGLWLLPLISFLFSDHPLAYGRFFSIWLLFSLGNAYMIYIATRQPLDHQTPRIVYSWFYRLYQVCFGMGVAGYMMILSELFGLTQLFFRNEDPAAQTWFAFGFYFMIYGIYLGVMGRDLAQLLADFMASSIGYYNQDGLPKKHLRDNVCAVCGDGLLAEDDVCQLECRHGFHEGCIRGWCLIGKRDMCPYCKEKVDLKMFRRQVWDAQTDLYLQLLDGVRYLVVWQPLILILSQGLIHLVGLK